MVNQTKLFAVEDLAEKLKSAKSVALIDYQGLTANQIAQLRKKVKDAGGLIQVIKNTLIVRSLAKIGVDLDQPLIGPMAVVIANENEIEPLKVISQTAKELKKPEFKLGVYQGQKLSLEQLLKFINLPGKEVLLAQLVGGLANPLSRLISGMKFNQAKLALVLKAMAEKKQNGN